MQHLLQGNAPCALTVQPVLSKLTRVSAAGTKRKFTGLQCHASHPWRLQFQLNQQQGAWYNILPHSRQIVCHAEKVPIPYPLDGLQSMEDIYRGLADRVAQAAAQIAPGQKYIIGIAGSPGSGKSTTAHAVCGLVNERCEAQGLGKDCAVVVPMDGFHYRRAQLDAMPNAEEAHARRGAHWTFDGRAFVECLQRIRETGEAEVPSFDHAAGDPVEGDISVTPAHRVLLVEGNYLLLDFEPWQRLSGLFDETWFIECGVDDAMERVFERQVAIGLKPEESMARISGNDRPNAVLVAQTRGRADLVVPSLPFRDG